MQRSAGTATHAPRRRSERPLMDTLGLSIVDLVMENGFEKTLLDDLSADIQAAAKAESQTERRSVVRSGFAIVEGLIHSIKGMILDDLHLNPGLHSIAEVAMLREEMYGVDRTGEIQTQPKFISTDANLRFTIKMLCRGTSDGSLDLSGRGWQAFKSSLDVRNRLAHPKQLSDLTVTDSEIRAFIEGLNWFLKNVAEKLSEVLEVARVEPKTKDSEPA
jgi:hypothetical protein